jgi:hypothetical protein
MPALRHPDVDGEINVSDDAAAIYARSGWERADGEPIEAAADPDGGGGPEPGPAPQVSIYHPGLDRHTTVPEVAVPHYRRSGWLLSSEWEAQNPAEDSSQDEGVQDGAQAAHEPPPHRSRRAGRATPQDDAGGDQAGGQGTTEKE